MKTSHRTALLVVCFLAAYLLVSPQIRQVVADTMDPTLWVKEIAKFTVTDQVRMYLEDVDPGVTIPISGIPNPLPVSGTVAISTNPVPVAGAVTQARAVPRFTCDETCATCNHAVTDVAAAFVVPASTIGTYRLTNNGAPVACLAGVAPVAVYLTHPQHTDGSEKEIRLPAGNYSCITSTGETSRVSLVPCAPTAEWAVP